MTNSTKTIEAAIEYATSEGFEYAQQLLAEETYRARIQALG